MQRRLPYEPEHLVSLLTSWIEWRYRKTRQRLVLTSAPTSVPQLVEEMVPGAVWRLAWHEDSTAVLYGLAPRTDPTKYLIVRHDATQARGEGVFERLSDGTWLPVDGIVLHSRLLGFEKSARSSQGHGHDTSAEAADQANVSRSRTTRKKNPQL